MATAERAQNSVDALNKCKDIVVIIETTGKKATTDITTRFQLNMWLKKKV